MSSDANTGSGSWHTNQNKSVNPPTPGNLDSDRELPTPDEKIAEFYREYPDRARLPLTDRHNTKLREKFTNAIYEEYVTDAPREWDTSESGVEIVEREPLTWGEAVERMVRSHEENRHTTINLEKGYPEDPEFSSFSLEVDTRWFSSYQQKYYAQLKAWLRELTGGDRPSGGSTEGIFENPRIALITRSGSSTPGGQRLAPVDHANELSNSWSSVYDALRNRMRSLGYDWQYDRRLEPHTSKRGGGTNAVYGHEHIVLVVDGPITASDLRPIVEKHVEECEIAGPSAHDLDVTNWRLNEEDIGTVEVKDPDEVENLAAYVASYAGIKPVDLLERSPEYIGWAAMMNAANLRTKSRSDAARQAAVADRCKQEFESELSDQDVDHGEEIRYSASGDVVCTACGSTHEIPQDESLVSQRLDGSPTLAADGGHDRVAEFKQSWSSARRGVRLGESQLKADLRDRLRTYLSNHPNASNVDLIAKPGIKYDPELVREIANQIRADYDPSEVVGFSRSPDWRVVSVTVRDEEFPASSGNGVNMVSVDRPKQNLLDNTLLGSNGAEKTRFRFGNGVSLNGGEQMAEFCIRNGIEDVDVVKETVYIERYGLADRLDIDPNDSITLEEAEKRFDLPG